MKAARLILALGLIATFAARAEDNQQWRQQQQRRQQWQQQQQQRYQQGGKQYPYQPRNARRPSSMYSEMTATTNREKNRFGLFLGVLEPLGTLVSANAAYNFTSYLRAQLGFGYLSALGASLTTVGASVKAFVPGWNFSPVAGLGVSYASFSASTTATGTGTTTTDTTKAGAFSASGLKAYGILGADWQARGGFNVGFGVEITTGPETSTVTGTGTTTTTTTTSGGLYLIPYVGLGWFFNWLG